MSFAWTDEAVSLLRRVAEQGGSYSMAAEALGVSRNAVARKAWRLGIAFRCDDRVRSGRIANAQRAWWASLSRSQRDSMANNMSASQCARWAGLSPEARAELVAAAWRARRGIPA